MGLRHTSGMFWLTAVVCMVVSPAIAQVKIGEIYDVKVEGYVIRDDVESPVKKPDPVYIGDLLGVHRRNSKLSVILSEGDDVPIEIRYGYMRLAGESGLIECQFKKGNFVIKGPPKPCKGSTPDILRLDEQGTLYEVDVQATNSLVFVFEGSVAVYSTNPEYPEPQLVHAGEWVRARKGEKIPKPQRFMWPPTPSSGSKECIYSNCKQTDNVLIPPPPVYTPWILTPPPDPNPPGQF